MKWRFVCMSLVLVAGLGLPVRVAFGQAQPPGPIPVLKKRFSLTPPAVLLGLGVLGLGLALRRGQRRLSPRHARSNDGHRSWPVPAFRTFRSSRRRR